MMRENFQHGLLENFLMMISSLWNCTIPVGVGFQPPDNLLLTHYLPKKNQGEDSQITIIPVIDVSKHEPRDLPARVLSTVGPGDRVWLSMAGPLHFFRPRNSCLTTPEGCWKQQGKPHGIKASGSEAEIGGKRILVFYLRGKPQIRTDWVIHEFSLPQGKYVLCRLRNKSDEFDQAQPEPGSGSCSMASNVENQAAPNGMNAEAEENQLASKQPCSGDYHVTPWALESQAASNGLITEAQENLAYKELLEALQIPNDNEAATSNGLQTGDKNQLSNFVEGQPDTYNSSHSVSVEELFPQPHPSQPYQLPQPHPPQDYSPSTQQSPISTKLGNVSHGTIVHDDECRKRNYPFGDKDPSLTKKNNTSTKDYDEPVNNTSSNSENQAAQWIPEGNYQPGENMELGFDSCQPQDYNFTLSSICGGPRDFSDYNDLIGLDELQSLLEDIDSSLAKSSDKIIDGGSGVSSDRNTEVIHGSVKDYSALPIGAEQRSNVNELP